VYSTTYRWKIVAWDNHDASATGPLWIFTTKMNKPTVFGTPIPPNGSIWNPLSITWSIPISDPEGDNFDWTIQCSNGQNAGANDASNGTKSLSLSGLAYTTTYKVWVNASDPGGSGLYTRKWYRFTTVEPPGPDLDCTGSLSWTSVPAGSTVTGEFTVSNIGDSGSLLNWEVAEYPGWGTWSLIHQLALV
jgi:hypothetical protein